MPTINAGSSATVALAAGQTLAFNFGSGSAQVVPPEPASVAPPLVNVTVGATVGPFEQPVSVFVRALQFTDYEVRTPADILDRTGRAVLSAVVLPTLADLTTAATAGALVPGTTYTVGLARYRALSASTYAVEAGSAATAASSAIIQGTHDTGPQNRPSPGYTVLADLRAANALSLSNCTVTDCERITPSGRRMRGIRMTATGGTAMSCDFAIRSQTFATGRINTLVYADYPSSLSGTHEFNTMVGDGAAFTNWFGALRSFDRTGWWLHAPGNAAGSSNARWSVGGGTPVWGATNFIRLRFRANFPAGQVPSVEIYEVTYNQDTPRSWFSIVVDDGYDSAYTLGAPAIERYGMRASFAVIADLVGQSGYMTLPQLRDLVERGHEIVVHGPIGGTGSLLNYVAEPNRDALARSDVQFHRNWIVANGLARGGSENVYVWPQGQDAWAPFDPSLRNIMSDLGFVGGRLAGTGPQTRRNRAGNSQWAHRIIGHTWTDAPSEPTNITNIVGRVNSAATDNCDVVLMLHRFVTGAAAQSLEIQVSNLETILQAAADNALAGTQEAVLFSRMAYANANAVLA